MMESYQEYTKPITNNDFVIYNFFKKTFDKSLEGLTSGTELEKLHITFDTLPENMPRNFFENFKELNDEEKEDLRMFITETLNSTKQITFHKLNTENVSDSSHDVFSGYLLGENSKQQMIDFLKVANPYELPDQEPDFGGYKRRKTVRRKTNKKRKTVRRRKSKTVRRRKTKTARRKTRR